MGFVSVSAVELAGGGSDTNGATPSSLVGLLIPWLIGLFVLCWLDGALAG